MRDLKDKIPGAESFTYGEFVKSDTATRKGIKNEPNEQQWKNIEKLAVNILQPIRNKFGRIRITSGFRSVELCEAVGSSAASNHTKGEAADIEPLENGVTLFDVFEFIHNNLQFRTIISEYFDNNGWVHVDFREGGNVKMLKLKDSKHNYTRTTLDEVRKLYG
jgi:uncharacterized protein YcbK (DUF882 family)